MSSPAAPSSAATGTSPVGGPQDASPNRRRPPRTYRRPVTTPDLVLTFGAFLVTTVIGVALMALLLATGMDPDVAAAGMLPTTVVLWVAGLWWALGRRGWTRADLGLVPSARHQLHLWWQVPLVWLLVLALTTVVLTLVMPGAEPADQGLGHLGLGPVVVVAVWLTVVVLGPLVEEVVFRRILLGWLETRVGFVLALLVQAALFGVMHVLPQVVVLTFLVGLAAGLLARWHRSLWPALLLHMLNNAVATALLLGAVS